MGLLDDAIREHLELKRRRGADPGEVAREQREVLDVPAEQLLDRGASDEVPAASALGDGDLAAPEVAGTEDALDGETAELDMSTVLSDEIDVPQAVVPEDSFEWEMPDPGGAGHPGGASSRVSFE